MCRMTSVNHLCTNQYQIAQGCAKTIQIALSKLIDLPISKSDSAFGHARGRHDPAKTTFVFFLYIRVNSTVSAAYVLYSSEIPTIEVYSTRRASSYSSP